MSRLAVWPALLSRACKWIPSPRVPRLGRTGTTGHDTDQDSHVTSNTRTVHGRTDTRRRSQSTIECVTTELCCAVQVLKAHVSHAPNSRAIKQRPRQPSRVGPKPPTSQTINQRPQQPSRVGLRLQHPPVKPDVLRTRPPVVYCAVVIRRGTAVGRHPPT